MVNRIGNCWWRGVLDVSNCRKKKNSYCSFDCNITINPFFDSNIPLAINFFTSYIGNSRKYFDSARSNIYDSTNFMSCLGTPPPTPGTELWIRTCLGNANLRTYVICEKKVIFRNKNMIFWMILYGIFTLEISNNISFGMKYERQL